MADLEYLGALDRELLEAQGADVEPTEYESLQDRRSGVFWSQILQSCSDPSDQSRGIAGLYVDGIIALILNEEVGITYASIAASLGHNRGHLCRLANRAKTVLRGLIDPAQPLAAQIHHIVPRHIPQYTPLTDGEWERARLLLPTDGRWRNLRARLDGLLWCYTTLRSMHSAPAEYGGKKPIGRLSNWIDANNRWDEILEAIGRDWSQ